MVLDPFLITQTDFSIKNGVWGVPLGRTCRWHQFGWVKMSEWLLKTQICRFLVKNSRRRFHRFAWQGPFVCFRFFLGACPLSNNTYIVVPGYLFWENWKCVFFEAYHIQSGGLPPHSFPLGTQKHILYPQTQISVNTKGGLHRGIL